MNFQVTGDFVDSPREILERHARTGEPMPVEIMVLGERFFGQVIVLQTGPGEFDCAAAGPLRKQEA